MNIAHDDDAVIARLRSALDEVSADSHGLVAIESPRERVSAGRWLAVAAAAVLIVGAVTAIAVNRSNAPEVASVPTEVPTTAPDKIVDTSEQVLIRTTTPWFRLIAADLVPGERLREHCCSSVSDVNIAWSNGDKLLLLNAVSKDDVTGIGPLGDSTIVETDTDFLGFQSVGLSNDERTSLASQVVPGSGFPFVLPVDGWEMVAFGQSTNDNGLVQLYTPATNDRLSSYMPTVEMRVGGYLGDLSLLAAFPAAQPVTVAGYSGWRVTNRDGIVIAFWDVGDGNWGRLSIDPALADRADVLIAGVIQVSEEAANEPTVDTVPAPDTVLAPTGGGLTVPMVGSQLTGNLVAAASKGPTLFVFVDPACVPCTNAVRTLLVAGPASPTQVPQIALVVGRPSEDPNTGDWLTEVAWEGTVVYDSDGSSAALFGIDAVPYFVFVSIDSDGTILDLITGLFTSETLAELGIA